MKRLGLVDKTHRYSYTQLESVSECPYMFYLERLEDHKDELVSNSFALQGSLIHDLVDKWAKGELKKEELPGEYKRRYPLEVPNDWPRMLASKGYASKTYEQGLQYFEDFNEFEGYEVIASEQRFTTKIDGRLFTGIIDMILKDKKTGEYIICDHKSKSHSSFSKNAKKMFRQQLMYAKYFKEKYKRFPDKLMFNLFKEGGMLVIEAFDEAQYDETIKWAKEQIEKIESYELLDWYTTKEGADEKKDFFCCNICSCRKICPNGY